MLQAVTHFYSVPGSLLVNFIIMTFFVKAGQYELTDYMKKHEIVNKIKYKITRAFIKVSLHIIK